MFLFGADSVMHDGGDTVEQAVEFRTAISDCFYTHLRYHLRRRAAQMNEKTSVNFISGSVAPNSPDLGPFAYNICGVMQQRVYRTLFRNVDELKK